MGHYYDTVVTFWLLGKKWSPSRTVLGRSSSCAGAKYRNCELIVMLSVTIKAKFSCSSLNNYFFQGVVTETIRRVKATVPAIQRKMQLYLANRETEFILFRPIRFHSLLDCFSVKISHWSQQVGHSDRLCHLVICAKGWVHLGRAGLNLSINAS